MPYRIARIFEIENGHMLSRHPDKCRFPHGHSRRVEIVVAAEDLDENGMVCDFKALREALDDFLRRYDHALCMNTRDPMFPVLREAFGERVIGFEATEPTTEVLAKHFFEEMERLLGNYQAQEGKRYPIQPQVRLERVRVWETSSTWAEYTP